MMSERVAVLYRGGPESDARLHLAVGDHPVPPACAGGAPREVLSQTYPYVLPLLEQASVPLLAALNSVAEQLAIHQLGQLLTPETRDRLCRRCATEFLA
jgi:hypothetical protein